MSDFSRNYLRACQEGRATFFADGKTWNVAALQKIRCAPKSIPSAVKTSIEGKPSSNPYARFKNVSADEFRQEVESIMEQSGCTRQEAARLLSQACGLSQERQTGSYFDRVKRSYKR